MRWYSSNDKLENVMRDAVDSENPQHGLPTSVQQDALRELRDRGIPEYVVESIRLGRITSIDQLFKKNYV